MEFAISEKTRGSILKQKIYNPQISSRYTISTKSETRQVISTYVPTTINYMLECIHV